MQHNESLNSLIDKASAIAGSDAALARLLGVQRQRVANWRNGNDTCSPEDCALLAGVAGVDPLAEMTRAMLRKHEGTPKGDRLMRVLGKPLQATGAALCSAGLAALAIFGTGTALPSNAHAFTVLHDVYNALRRKYGSARYNRYSNC